MLVSDKNFYKNIINYPYIYPIIYPLSKFGICQKYDNIKDERVIMDILDRLAKSKFRSRFKLRAKEISYLQKKGLEVVRKHACDFIRERIAPAEPLNDGKQTPTRNHPVFIAQHATATCCRKCIEKWHKFPRGKELTESEQNYLVDLIMRWIENQIPHN